MQELIVTIVKGLVDDKDAVCVTVDLPKEDGTVVYHLHVAPVSYTHLTLPTT